MTYDEAKQIIKDGYEKGTDEYVAARYKVVAGYVKHMIDFVAIDAICEELQGGEQMKHNKVKLHVGGVYKARNGDRVEIVRYNGLNCHFPIIGDNGRSYTLSGGYFTDEESEHDLIAEWQDEPAVGQWIGWNGGPCPVHPETVVDITGHDLDRVSSFAHEILWNNFRGAYRVITPYVEPKKAREFWLAERNGMMIEVHCHVSDAIHVREVLDDE